MANRARHELLIAEHRGEYVDPKISTNIYWQIGQVFNDVAQEARLSRPEVKIFTGWMLQNIHLMWSTDNKDRSWVHGNKRIIAAYNLIRRRYHLSLGGNLADNTGNSMIVLPASRDRERDLDRLRGQILEIVEGQDGPLAKKYDCTLWCLENGRQIRANN